MTDGSLLVRFYLNQAPDRNGRKLVDIQSWDDDALESTHDYIQWMFPLPEPSAFSSDAPILTDVDIREFKRDARIRRNLLVSYHRMLRFYGLKIYETEAALTVAPSKKFRKRAADWLTRENHNFLRITRILRCMQLLGFKKHSLAFLRCLRDLYATNGADNVGSETMDYWEGALKFSTTAEMLASWGKGYKVPHSRSPPLRQSASRPKLRNRPRKS